jgi:hypothetical protein
VQRLRLVVAVFAVAIVVSIGAVLALAAPGALSQAASPNAGAAKSEYCPAGEQARRKAALRHFQKNMLKNRRRFFRTHKSPAARKRFVKKQQKQLRALRRAIASCD